MAKSPYQRLFAGDSPQSPFTRLTNLFFRGPLPKATPMQEMGVSGTAVFGGLVLQREKDSKLVGARKWVTFSEIVTNTSIVASGVRYMFNLIAYSKWSVEPANESPEAEKVAAFVEDVINDTTTPFRRIARRASMYRFHGFGIQEWTAKRRSKDGKIGLDDIEARPQHTVERWQIDDSGSVVGVWQRPPMGGAWVVQPTQGGWLYLPRSKIIYMVDDSLTDAPDGLGLLRHLVEPYERIQRYLELEGRGFERDLRGTPIGRVPYAQIAEMVKTGQLTKEDGQAIVMAVEKFVSMQAKSSDTSIVLDSAPYVNRTDSGDSASSVMQYGIELLKGDSESFAEIGAAVDRLNHEMARVLGVENLLLGDKGGGSRALAADKSQNFYLIVNGTLDEIADACNKDVVIPICDLNGIKEELRPKLKHSEVSFRTVQEVTGALAQMAQAGAVLSPTDPAIDDVRDLLGISRQPEPSPEMMGLNFDIGGDIYNPEGSVPPLPQQPGQPGQTGPITGKPGGKQPPQGGGSQPQNARQQIAGGKNPQAANDPQLTSASGFFKRNQDFIKLEANPDKLDHLADLLDDTDIIAATEARKKASAIRKDNPNHDEHGRFATSGFSGFPINPREGPSAALLPPLPLIPADVFDAGLAQSLMDDMEWHFDSMHPTNPVTGVIPNSPSLKRYAHALINAALSGDLKVTDMTGVYKALAVSAIDAMVSKITPLVHWVVQDGKPSLNSILAFSHMLIAEYNRQAANERGAIMKVGDTIMIVDRDDLEKFNEAHDDHGRFASGGSGGSHDITHDMSLNPNSRPSQSITSLGDLYAKARADEPAFQKEVARVADLTNGKMVLPQAKDSEPGTSLKRMSSAERKMRDELNGDPSKLLDVARATITYKTVEESRQGLAKFVADNRNNIVRIKDRYENPVPGGYRDILVNFRLQSGTIAELQFSTNNLLNAKFGKGHDLYEQMRDPSIKKTDALSLEAESRYLYDRAFKADGNSKYKRG